MKRIKKPAPLKYQAWFENTEFIPADLQSSLRKRLPRRMSPETASAFMARCSAAAQLMLETSKKTSTGKVAADLEKAADRARALLTALKALSADTRSTLGVHLDALAYLTNPPERLSALSLALLRPESPSGEYRFVRTDGFFLGVCDVLSDLEMGARYAQSKCKPSRQSKVSENNARHLVREVANAYRYLHGKLPPRNAGTWFPPFVTELGRFYGYKCGLKLTRNVILEMEMSVSPSVE